MAKFIVSKDMELYTTYGAVRAEVVFEEFMKNKLNKNFKLAGFFNAAEVLSSVKSMEKIESENVIIGRYKSIGVNPIIIKFFNEQRAMTAEGKFIEVASSNPGDLLLSLNGLLEVDYIEILNDENKENMHTFIIIETENALPTLYVNNLIVLPVLEVDVKNPFFEHYQFI